MWACSSYCLRAFLIWFWVWLIIFCLFVCCCWFFRSSLISERIMMQSCVRMRTRAHSIDTQMHKKCGDLSTVQNLWLANKKTKRIICIDCLHSRSSFISRILCTLIFPDSFNTINSTQCLTGYDEIWDYGNLYLYATRTRSSHSMSWSESCEFCIAYSHRVHIYNHVKIENYRELCWKTVDSHECFDFSSSIFFSTKFMIAIGGSVFYAVLNEWEGLNNDPKCIKTSVSAYQ